MDVASGVGPIVKAGHLTKQGGHHKNWRKRWFEQREGILHYYKNEGDAAPQGSISLDLVSRVEQVRGEGSKKDRAFQFRLLTIHRTFFVCASSQDEMNEWIASIRSGLTAGGDRVAEEEQAGFGYSRRNTTSAAAEKLDRTRLMNRMSNNFGSEMDLNLMKSRKLRLLGSYVPTVVRKKYKQRPHLPEEAVCERFRAAVMFADISGFTPMTEKLCNLGPEGVEQLTSILNDYFGQLVNIVKDHGGDIVKYAGDAVMCLWKVESEKILGLAQMTQLAGQCGLALIKQLNNFKAGEFSLSLHIGIGAGSMFGLHVGGVNERWEYLVAGAPLKQVADAEHNSQTGEVVLSPQAWRVIKDVAQGQLVVSSDDKDKDRDDSEACWRLLAIKKKVTLPPIADTLITMNMERALRAYVPAAVTVRLDAGHTKWLGELRKITVMFVMLNDLQFESAADLDTMQSAVEALQLPIHQYEGTVRQFIMDDKGAVLIGVWGLPPHVHEDDAYRACAAGLDMQAALKELDLGCSIGITTGKAFCGAVGSFERCEYAAVGDIVNLAARLMVASQHDGGLLTDTATYDSSQSKMDFAFLRSIKVKGKVDAVDVYRPLKKAEKQGRNPGSPAASGQMRRARMPFIGRQKQLKTVSERIKQLDAGIHGAAILLEGEAGIGKTRLLDEIEAIVCGDVYTSARYPNIQLIRCMGDANNKNTYFVWRHIMETILELDHSLSGQAKQDAVLKRLLEHIPSVIHLAPLLNEVIPDLDFAETEKTSKMPAQVRAENVRFFLLAIIQSISKKKHVLILIDNGQWLDSASWGLAHFIAKRLSHVVLIIALRHIEEDIPEYVELCELSNTQCLTLECMNTDDTGYLVAEVMEAVKVSESVLQLIMEKGHGNPFFSEELTLHLQETGRLMTTDTGMVQFSKNVAASDKIKMPSTLQDVISSRIDRLSPAQQALLKTASVIGRVFPLMILKAVHPIASDIRTLHKQLDALIAFDLVTVEQEGSADTSSPAAGRRRAALVGGGQKRAQLWLPPRRASLLNMNAQADCHRAAVLAAAKAHAKKEALVRNRQRLRLRDPRISALKMEEGVSLPSTSEPQNEDVPLAPQALPYTRSRSGLAAATTSFGVSPQTLGQGQASNRHTTAGLPTQLAMGEQQGQGSALPSSLSKPAVGSASGLSINGGSGSGSGLKKSGTHLSPEGGGDHSSRASHGRPSLHDIFNRPEGKSEVGDPSDSTDGADANDSGPISQSPAAPASPYSASPVGLSVTPSQTQPLSQSQSQDSASLSPSPTSPCQDNVDPGAEFQSHNSPPSPSTASGEASEQGVGPDAGQGSPDAESDASEDENGAEGPMWTRGRLRSNSGVEMAAEDFRDSTVYAFKHGDTQETLYNLMLFSQRRELHRGVATWYENICADELENHYPLLMHHWRQAGDNRKTLFYLKLGAKKALRQFLNREAAELLNEALELCEVLQVTDVYTLVVMERQLGECYYNLGNFEKAEYYLNSMLKRQGRSVPKDASSTKLVSEQLQQSFHRKFASFRRRRTSSNVDAVDDKTQTMTLQSIRALLCLAKLKYYQCDPGASSYCNFRALNLAEGLGNICPELVEAYGNIILSAGIARMDNVAEHYISMGRSAANEADTSLSLANVLQMTGYYYSGLAQWEKAQAALNEASKISEAVGDRRRYEECTEAMGLNEFFQGNIDRSVQLTSEAYESATARGDKQFQVHLLNSQARNHLAVGNLKEARAILEKAIILKQQLGSMDLSNLIPMNGLLGLAWLRMGRDDDAFVMAKATYKIFKNLKPATYFSLPGYIAATEILVTLFEGHVWEHKDGASMSKERKEYRSMLAEKAKKTLGRLETFAQTFPIAEPAAKRWKAVLAGVQGHGHEAENELLKAVMGARKLGMKRDVALSYFHMGRLASGPERLKNLATAAKMFTEMGCQHDKEMAELFRSHMPASFVPASTGYNQDGFRPEALW